MPARPTDLIGSFNRLDRGETYVDHHVFFCIQGKKTGLNHLAYEVQDVDDVMIGHNHLKTKGYAHVWGVGRHQLGSHIYDRSWQDPWGRVHEHWTDTDTLNAHALPGLHGVDALNGPWGEPNSAIFRTPRVGVIRFPSFFCGAERPYQVRFRNDCSPYRFQPARH